MKKIKISFKIDRTKIANVFVRLLKYKRLFYIMFFGILIIYNFNIIYKDVYLGINYISYLESENLLDGKREEVRIQKVVKDIQYRVERIKKEMSYSYKDPFNFGELQENDAIDDTSDDVPIRTEGNPIVPPIGKFYDQ